MEYHSSTLRLRTWQVRQVFVGLASIEELAYEGPLRCDPRDVNGLPYRVALVMCELIKEYLKDHLGIT